MKRFSKENVVGWLGRNGLSRALQCFEGGEKCFDTPLGPGSDGRRHVWIHCSEPEAWIGGALLGLCEGWTVWFIPPVWTQDVVLKLEAAMSADAVLSDTGWRVLNHPSGWGHSRGVAMGGFGLGQLMILTGGSSGHLRFAVHNVETLQAAVDGVARHFMGRSWERTEFNYCNDLPLWHVSGWMQVVRSFLSDSSFFIGEHCRDDWGGSGSGRWLSVVPTQLQRMLKHEAGRRLLRLADTIVVGGAPCSEVILSACLEESIHPWVTYGMTETLGMIAGKRIEHSDALLRPASVFPHASVEILEEGNNRSKREGQGEIVIRSASLCQGYVMLQGNGELQWDEVGSCLRTRDLGCLEPNAGLHVWGRMDDLIITGGEKVNPLEVRSHLLAFPGIEDCLVTGMDDDEWGECVVCLFRVAASGVPSEFGAEDLKQFLAKRMESFKIPKRWRCVDVLPYDEKGKVQNERLEAVLAEVFAN